MLLKFSRKGTGVKETSIWHHKQMFREWLTRERACNCSDRVPQLTPPILLPSGHQELGDSNLDRNGPNREKACSDKVFWFCFITTTHPPKKRLCLQIIVGISTFSFEYSRMRGTF